MMSSDPMARGGKSPADDRPLSRSPMQTTSFRIDEGYSEETRSQAGSDAASPSPSRAEEMPLVPAELGIPAWVATLSEAERSGM